MSRALDDYPALLRDIKARIQGAQVRAALAADRQLLLLYWEVGHLIAARQEQEGWGAAVITRLARDLASELPGVQGFSERNLKPMVQFFRAYPEIDADRGNDVGSASEPMPIGPQAVAQFREGSGEPIGPQAVAQTAHADPGLARWVLGVPWGHNILLAKDSDEDSQ